MSENKDQRWIFATMHEGSLYPERIITLEDLDSLEYADVRDSLYQLWEWPSGDIYEIAPDREVDSANEYSVPYNNRGTVWLPILRKTGSDKKRVDDALDRLSKS